MKKFDSMEVLIAKKELLEELYQLTHHNQVILKSLRDITTRIMAIQQAKIGIGLLMKIQQ